MTYSEIFTIASVTDYTITYLVHQTGCESPLLVPCPWTHAFLVASHLDLEWEFLSTVPCETAVHCPRV